MMKEKINPEIWQNYDEARHIELKAKLIKEWIPSDVKSILDLGCGNGIITNNLAKDYRVLGVDISIEALEQVQAEKLQASATQVPLPDKSFDLVLSSEMIEHLNGEDLLKAIGEMKRLSARYILISVPNREQLAKSFCRCASCGEIYHAYGHLQSFTPSDMKALFNGYEMQKKIEMGPPEQIWNPLLLKLKQQLARQYFHPHMPVLCPICGSDKTLMRSNLLAKALNLANRALSPTRAYWLMLLFQKNYDTGRLITQPQSRAVTL